MSRSWNGEDLVNEFSQLLGDTSTAFKNRVLGWANDTIVDICSRHDWGHLNVKGKKILEIGEERQSLEVSAPAAPDVSLATDGSLTAGSIVSFLVTFVQANGVETIAGAESASLTITESERSVDLENIPTSQESLVTKRKIYIKVDDADYYYHSQIDDNISTEITIDSLPDSTIEPPDYFSVRKLDGAPFFEESQSNRLIYKGMDQLRMLIEGRWTQGTPEFFNAIKENEIALYPVPSRDLEVSFNYFRNPFRLYKSTESQPDMPATLKPLLKAGVIALGYEYRDRDGQESKRQTYEALLVDAINRISPVANVEYSIRDVVGNTDGFEVN